MFSRASLLFFFTCLFFAVTRTQMANFGNVPNFDHSPGEFSNAFDKMKDAFGNDDGMPVPNFNNKPNFDDHVGSNFDNGPDFEQLFPDDGFSDTWNTGMEPVSKDFHGASSNHAKGQLTDLVESLKKFKDALKEMDKIPGMEEMMKKLNTQTRMDEAINHFDGMDEAEAEKFVKGLREAARTTVYVDSSGSCGDWRLPAEQRRIKNCLLCNDGTWTLDTRKDLFNCVLQQNYNNTGSGLSIDVFNILIFSFIALLTVILQHL